MSQDRPFNPLPVSVLLLAGAIAAIELVFQLGDRGILGGASGVGYRIAALNEFAFLPQVFDRMLETGATDLSGLKRFVTYGFVHQSFGHVMFVVVLVLALGKLVGETFEAWTVPAIFLVASAVGALAYGVTPTAQALTGGYPGAYGLIGAYTFVLWVGLGVTGQNQMGAFQLIALLMGIQLAFGLLFGGGLDWVADLAGFAAGFAMSFLVSPGGWARVRAKLRHR